jgi:ribosome-binding factor A
MSQPTKEKAYKAGRIMDIDSLVEADIKIYVTTNYDMFTLSDLNRDVTLSKKLVENIKHNDLTQYNPILVDKRLTIVDGQHRFIAEKELGIPVYFIVSDKVKINDAADINQATKNWTTENYILHFAKRNFPVYQKLIAFGEKYQQPLTNLLALGKASADKNKTITELVRKGKFQFRETDVRIKELMTNFKDFQEIYDFANTTIFFKAYIRVASLENYTHAHMVKKLNEASGIIRRQPTQQLLIEEIIKLYNYGTKKNKLTLDKQGDKAKAVKEIAE